MPNLKQYDLQRVNFHVYVNSVDGKLIHKWEGPFLGREPASICRCIGIMGIYGDMIEWYRQQTSTNMFSFGRVSVEPIL